MNIFKTALLVSASFTVPVFFSIIASTGAHAQSGGNISIATPKGNEADIVVTANRVEQQRFEVGQSITVVTADQLETRQTAVLSDVLRTLPGVTTARNGGVGGTTSVFIRGGNSSQTLVLIDGVRINDPSSPSGAFDFSNLMTGNIARVEVLRGPNSVIWGSQAVGGVINIQTIEPTEDLAINARGEYGFRDTAQGVANISGKSGIFSGSFGGGYLRTDGISAFDENQGGTERDGFRSASLNGKLRIDLADNFNIDLRGFYIDSRTEFDNPPRDTVPVTDNEQFIGYVGVNLALLDGRFRNRVAYARTDINRVTTDPTPGSFNPFDASGVLDRLEYQGVFEASDFATLIFGAEHEESRSSTFFAAFDTNPDVTQTGLTSFYGQAVVKPFNGLTIAGGVRVDDHEVFGSETSLGGNFAYTPNDGATVLRGTYAEGFRAPALPELLANFGNPDLQPEIAKSYDVGIEQSLIDGRLRASATYFLRNTQDLIAFSSATFSLENIDLARAQGVELGLVLNPVDALTIQAQYSLIDTTNRSTALDFFGNSNFGNQLARRPEQTVSVIADWQTPWGLDVGATVLLVDDSFDDVANNRPLEGYVLADIRASYAVTDNIEAYGRIENLFDEQYQTASNFGQPGRAGYVGVRLRY